VVLAYLHLLQQEKYYTFRCSVLVRRLVGVRSMRNLKAIFLLLGRNREVGFSSTL
jgi:hypothetical protein